MNDRPPFDRQRNMVAAFVDMETATEYLRTVFEIVPLGVAIALDPECRDIRANHMLAEQLGMSAEENISKTRTDEFVPPYRVFANGVELSGNDLPLQRAMLERRTVELEHTVRRADGSEVIIAASAMPLFDASGEVRGGVYASLDVTAQRRAEAAARQQEQALATVLERIADGMVIYDRELKVTYANRAACEVARRSPDELVGLSVAEVMGEDHEVYSSSYRRVIDSGRQSISKRSAADTVPGSMSTFILTKAAWRCFSATSLRGTTPSRPCEPVKRMPRLSPPTSMRS